MTQNTEHRYAAKIAGLLAKAESTTPEEAELLIAKAQELMVKYAIEEELVLQAQGRKRTAEITQDEIAHTGIYRQAKFDITSEIAKANGCRVMIDNRNWRKPAEVACILVGFEDDIERIRMLDASIQIQAAAALAKWWKDNAQPWWSGMDKYKQRREFLFGFARGLRENLALAQQRAQAEVVEEQAAAQQVDESVVAEGVALVVRDRKQAVADWYDKEYGGRTRSVTRNYSRGGGDANHAGRAEGRRADVGRDRLGKRGELGRGS